MLFFEIAAILLFITTYIKKIQICQHIYKRYKDVDLGATMAPSLRDVVTN
jgi:hypothetical protein